MFKKILLWSAFAVGFAHAASGREQADVIRKLGNIYQLKDGVSLDQDSFAEAAVLLSSNLQARAEKASQEQQDRALAEGL